MVGSHLIRCTQCGEGFTATAWLLHAHNCQPGPLRDSDMPPEGGGSL